MDKTEFYNDLNTIINKISNDDNFSLVRFGDGEYRILKNMSINYEKIKMGEFKYEPNSYKYQFYYDKLWKSLTYKSKSYYVGIVSPCCHPPVINAYKWMKKISGQSESNLTWATIFSNSNYKFMETELIPEIQKHKIVLIANHKSDFGKLPFKSTEIFRIGTNAWIKNYDLLKTLKHYIHEYKIINQIFLFCAGPLSNIIIYELHKFNKQNFYIDLGSALDGFLFKSKLTRKYQWTIESEHNCEWF